MASFVGLQRVIRPRKSHLPRESPGARAARDVEVSDWPLDAAGPKPCNMFQDSDFTFLVLRTSLKGLGCWRGLLLPLASGVCLPNGIPASERKLLVARLQEVPCASHAVLHPLGG